MARKRKITVTLEDITDQDVQPSFIEKYLPNYNGEPVIINLTGRLRGDRAVMWGNLLTILHKQEVEKGKRDLTVRVENYGKYKRILEDSKG